MVMGGLGLLAREEFTPTSSSANPGYFPAATSIQLSTSRPTLVVFVHPLCPCTRATFHELNEVLATDSNRLAVVIVFTIAKGLPANWRDGDLWRSARAIPGAQLVEDDGGREATRFGAIGSGTCELFSPQGRLLFNGGITGSRGHEGDNRGEHAVLSLVAAGKADITSTPVFGCALR